MRTDKEILSIDPSLPPQIPYVKVRTFYFAGAGFSASINATNTNITRVAVSSSLNLNTTSASGNVSFVLESTNTTYTIAINETITIPNRLYWQTLTEQGNLVQCLPVNSEDAYAQGSFPLAAVDGATSTRWQPSSNESASMTVNMTTVPFAQVSRVFFDWGLRPPKSAAVYLSNSTDVNTYVVELELDAIEPSLPFNETAFALSNQDVTPYVGNTSTFYIPAEAEIWSGKFARLVIEGCWEEDGQGSTVGEFVLAS